MKATELMVGDLVCLKDDIKCELPLKVDGVLTDDISLEGEGFLGGAECLIRPILITPEMLVKNGWKETQYWHEYQDGKNTIQCCLPDMRGRINGIEIEHFKCEYVHQYQHLLRLCGFDELADNFKV